MRETPYSDSIVARAGDGAEKEKKSPVPVIRFRRRREVLLRGRSASGRRAGASGRACRRARRRACARDRANGRGASRSRTAGVPPVVPPVRLGRAAAAVARARERERPSRPRRSREHARRRPPRSSSRSRARYRPLIASSIRSSARYRRFLSTPKMSTSSSFPSGSSRSGVKKQNVFVSRSIERSVAPPEPCTRPAAPRGMRSSVQSSRFSRSGTVKCAARRCFRSQASNPSTAPPARPGHHRPPTYSRSCRTPPPAFTRRALS